jgi:hypothetical protein
MVELQTSFTARRPHHWCFSSEKNQFFEREQREEPVFLQPTEAEGKKPRKAWFFEKKKRKTFIGFACGPAGQAQPRVAKVFWFFFSKKNRFLPLAFPTLLHPPHRRALPHCLNCG